MPVDFNVLEIEGVTNLYVRGEAMPVDLNALEIERVTNLVVNFGWTKVKEELTDDDIILTIKKPRAEPVKEFGEGAD